MDMSVLIDICGALIIGFVTGFLGNLFLPNFLVGPLAIAGSVAFLGLRRKGWFQDENESRPSANDIDN